MFVTSCVTGQLKTDRDCEDVLFGLKQTAERKFQAQLGCSSLPVTENGGATQIAFRALPDGMHCQKLHTTLRQDGRALSWLGHQQRPGRAARDHRDGNC